MTEHPAPGPTTTVRLCAGERANAAETIAAFADLICADHELLRSEFDAIIAANLLDTDGGGQRLVPAGAVTTATAPLWPHRCRAMVVTRPGRDGCARAQNLRARQRSPPAPSVDPRQVDEPASDVLRQPLDRNYSADCIIRLVESEVVRHRDGGRSRQTGG